MRLHNACSFPSKIDQIAFSEQTGVEWSQQLSEGRANGVRAAFLRNMVVRHTTFVFLMNFIYELH